VDFALTLFYGIRILLGTYCSVWSKCFWTPAL